VCVWVCNLCMHMHILRAAIPCLQVATCCPMLVIDQTSGQSLTALYGNYPWYRLHIKNYNTFLC